MESRDWFIILLLAAVWAAGTVYLFKHPGVEVFVTWAEMGTTMGGIYHWLVLVDSKRPDA